MRSSLQMLSLWPKGLDLDFYSLDIDLHALTCFWNRSTSSIHLPVLVFSSSMSCSTHCLRESITDLYKVLQNRSTALYDLRKKKLFSLRLETPLLAQDHSLHWQRESTRRWHLRSSILDCRQLREITVQDVNAKHTLWLALSYTLIIHINAFVR